MKNTGLLMIMELGIRLTDALVALVVARYLGPLDFGLLAAALSFAWLFSILPGFGMGSLTTRDIAQDPGQMGSYIGNGLAAKVMLAGLTFIVMGAVAWVSGFAATRALAVMLAGILMVVDTNVRYLLSFFQAVQWMGTMTVVSLFIRAGWVVGSLWVMGMHGGVLHLLGIRVLVTATGFLVSLALIHWKLSRLSWRFSPPVIFRMLKDSLPFAVFRLRGQLYMDIDTVMVSLMRGDLMTGWYAAAQKFLRVLSFIPDSFANALLPELAGSQAAGASRAAARTLGRICRYLSIIGFPVAVVVSLLAGRIVLLLYGPAYAPAVPALQILIWGVPFTFLNGALLAALAAANQERKGSGYLILGALFSSLSNFAVIPLFGHVGAASTTFLAEVFIFVLQVRLLGKTLPGFTPLERRHIGPLVTTLAGLGAAAFLTRSLPWAASIPLMAIVYAGFLLAFRLVEAADWQFLRKRRLKTAPADLG